jgi:hypothetical protein
MPKPLSAIDISVDFKIDVTHLSKGIYFIKISNDIGKQSSKFLKI